jgi:2-keto-4-pentenoate hydratase
MTPTDFSAIAAALLQARRNHQPVDASPFTDQLKSASDAYVVQQQVLAGILGPLAPFSMAWKSGGPNRTSPLTHAALLPAGILKNGADMSAWPLNIRIVEIEIAFKIKQAVTPSQAAALTLESSRDLIEAMTVSIEVVDSRWQQAGAVQALLKLADMQSHGALVLGAWQPYTQSDHARDWTQQVCSLQIGDQAPVSFTGTHTLQDPTWVLVPWLQYATSQGQTVPAGTVITTGSWCGMPFAQKGDLIIAEFEGIGKTSVQL